MPIHDRYARITPYEVTLPSEEDAERHLTPILSELDEENAPDLATFLSSASVRSAVEALREPGTGRMGPEIAADFGVLLFHLAHFRKADYPVFLLETAAARFLVEFSSPDRAESVTPDPATGYLQLPRNLFWMEGADGPDGGPAPPVTVDGIFWCGSEHGTHLLVVGGIAPNRAGVTAVPLAPIDASTLAGLIDTPIRESEEDFATSLPGAEIEGLYEFRTTGEVVKLFARFVAGFLTGGATPPLRDPAPRESGDIPPSRFPYRSIAIDPDPKGDHGA